MGHRHTHEQEALQLCQFRPEGWDRLWRNQDTLHGSDTRSFSFGMESKLTLHNSVCQISHCH